MSLSSFVLGSSNLGSLALSAGTLMPKVMISAVGELSLYQLAATGVIGAQNYEPLGVILSRAAKASGCGIRKATVRRPSRMVSPPVT